VYVDFDTIRYLWPEVILVLIATWIYLGGTIQPNRGWWTTFSLAAYAVSAYVILWKEGHYWSSGGSEAFMNGPIIVDFLGYVFRCLAVTVGALFTLIAASNARRELASEYLASLMLLVVGLMLVARANDVIFLFVSLELISIPTYVLLYLGRRDRATSEATAKYFFLSILSSALLLYGLSFWYGLTGSTTMAGLAEGATAATNSEITRAFASQPVFVYLALVLLVAGLGFKIAAVPFHFYAPDVYQGATNTNAGLLAVAPKLAGILALVRLLVLAFPQAASFGWQLSLVLAILTMTIGNICALWQQNLRRLLAYSSIAHAGYMLIGISVAFAATESETVGQGGITATLFYVFVYTFASLGTFATLVFLGSDVHEVNGVDELAGLGRSRPWVALALSVFMFSLAGIPPLAGFWGKLTLFFGALRTAMAAPESQIALWFTILAIAGALNAAIAAAYYLRVIAVMYFRTPHRALPACGGWGSWFTMAFCAALIVGVGIMPRQPMAAARRSELSSRSEVMVPQLAEVAPTSE
jgi:NADH-quinone oxidoreductase subunit N